MHSNRSNPSQFRVSHLSRQSTVRLYCMAAVWYRYCNVWLLYGTNYCMVLYGTVWLQLYSCTVWYRTRTVWLLYGTGTTVRLYGTVWLYSCMVLYGQYTTIQTQQDPTRPTSSGNSYAQCRMYGAVQGRSIMHRYSHNSLTRMRCGRGKENLLPSVERISCMVL